MQLKIHLGLVTLVFALGCSTIESQKLPAAHSAEKTLEKTGARRFLSQEDAETRFHQVGKVNYTTWIGLDANHHEFEGRQVIRFDLKDRAEDAGRDLFIDLVDAKISTIVVNRVAIPENKIGDIYDGSRIRLRVKALESGTNRVEIAYSKKYADDGNGLVRYKDEEDGNVYIYSNFEPYSARLAFPCFDQPDLKASLELTVEAPEDWSVISNSLETDSSIVDGRKVWTFPPTLQLSTYVLALIAGPYQAWKADNAKSGVPLRLFARQSLAKHVDASEWLDVTDRGIKQYSDAFEYPFPYTKYDQIIVPQFNEGAMENAGAVTFSEEYVFKTKVTTAKRRDRSATILHELAHMWFGDLVTMKWWNGLWLNESFASFAPSWLLGGTVLKGVSARDLNHGEKQWAFLQDRLETTHPIETIAKNTQDAFANFDGITYAKGAAVLDQLLYLVGDSQLKKSLAAYFQRHALGNTNLDDFFSAISDTTKRNFKDWKDEWLLTSGFNSSMAEWSCDGEHLSSLVLIQKADPYSKRLRTHATRLALLKTSKGGLKIIASPRIEYQNERTTLRLAGELANVACPDAIFTNFEDHDYAQAILDKKSLPVILQRYSDIKDSWLRGLLAQSLWLMVDQGQLTARQYLDFVYEHSRDETDPLNLKTLLGDLDDAIWYLPKNQQMAENKRAKAFAREQISKAIRGSDEQLLWFHTYLGLYSPDTPDQDWIEELLAQSPKALKGIKGISLDQEKRWDLITSAARNYGSPKVLTWAEAEAKTDKSEKGQAHLLTIKTMLDRPHWLRIFYKLEPSTVAPHQIQQAMGAYYNAFDEDGNQSDLVPFLNRLLDLNATETEEYLSGFSASMLPPLCSLQAASQIRTYLGANPNLHPATAKHLRSRAQAMEICVRARALNPI